LSELDPAREFLRPFEGGISFEEEAVDVGLKRLGVERKSEEDFDELASLEGRDEDSSRMCIAASSRFLLRFASEA